jgi:hypothetical protein
LFPRIGFVVTNSRLPAGKVVKVYNGRAEIENRIKEGKNTLRWDKTSCQKFGANHARLKMGVLAYNLLHMIRQFYVWREEVKRSIDYPSAWLKNLWKFELSLLPRENWGIKKGTSCVYTRGNGYPKPFLTAVAKAAA